MKEKKNYTFAVIYFLKRSREKPIVLFFFLGDFFLSTNNKINTQLPHSSKMNENHATLSF